MIPLRSPATCNIKRSFDIGFSALVLAGFFPVFAVVAFCIVIDGGPVFFVQPRIGRNGKIFSCYKFRSMCTGAEEQLQEHLAADDTMAAHWKKYQKLPRDGRETGIGKIIRRLDLDELPQFFNVLLGDMSVVGPRPMLPDQREDYGDTTYYNMARPGITGLWQVSGRNRRTFAERAELDRKYINEWNLKADAMILLKTIPAIVRGEGKIKGGDIL